MELGTSTFLSRNLWLKGSVFLAALGLCVAQSGCARVIDVFEGQDPTPGIQKSLELAVAAGNAAIDDMERHGSFDTTGWAMTPDGDLIIGAKSTPTRVFEFKETLQSNAIIDGQVTEAEILQVQCTYGTGSINVSDQFDGRFAVSLLQRQNGKWTENVLRNDIGESLPASVCETVATQLPDPRG